MARVRRGVLSALVLLPPLGACGDSTSARAPGPAAAISATSGGGQASPVGSSLAAPLVATVTDTAGLGVPAVEVIWTAPPGTTVQPAGPLTDKSGRATASVSLGADAGGFTVTAGVAGLPEEASFAVTALPGAALVAAVEIARELGFVHDQFVRDGLVFVSAWGAGLIIYDVGHGVRGGAPNRPVEVGRVVTSSAIPGGAAVHNAWWYHAPDGEKRYVFVGQEGPGAVGQSSSGDIYVVDVSDLTQPREVAFYRMAGSGTHNFWVDETSQILYAAYYDGGVVALDVSGTLSGDLAAREIARVRPGGVGNTYVWGVQLGANGSLYASDMLSGLWQLRLADGAFQVVAGGNNVDRRYTSELWVHGRYAYTGTWGAGTAQREPGDMLFVWRLDDAGAPSLVDSVFSGGTTRVGDVEVSADGALLVFAGEGGPGAGVHLLSPLANPARPAPLAFMPVAEGIHTATLGTIAARRYVFAARNATAARDGALLIFDVTSLVP